MINELYDYEEFYFHQDRLYKTLFILETQRMTKMVGFIKDVNLTLTNSNADMCARVCTQVFNVSTIKNRKVSICPIFILPVQLTIPIMPHDVTI